MFPNLCLTTYVIVCDEININCMRFKGGTSIFPPKKYTVKKTSPFLSSTSRQASFNRQFPPPPKFSLSALLFLSGSNFLPSLKLFLAKMLPFIMGCITIVEIEIIHLIIGAISCHVRTILGAFSTKWT